MRIADFAGKNVCVLGYGREGQATVRALERHAPGVEITVADRSETVDIPSKHWHQTGSGWLENLEKFDAVIKSPGITPAALQNVRATFTCATQIFLDTVAETGATVVGVTGSKGKSTTSSLIHAILLQAGKRSVLCGNIGKPALDTLDRVTADTIIVLEMSSYQLMDVTRSPRIAVITSFFPEHLDYHGSLDAYRDAKAHITRFQTKEDIVFFDALSQGAKAIASESAGRRIPFSAQSAPLKIDETQLRGTHNLSNIAAACDVAAFFGVDRDTCIAAIRTFHGLPHRLQSLGVRDGIEWIDDAISTTPESAVAALDALGDNVAAVILGGQDRGNDFSILAKRLQSSHVQLVILQGASGARIRGAIEATGATVRFAEATTMEQVVRAAKESVPSGGISAPIVLLSPASPSYDLFKNFEERGEAFAKAVGI